MPSTIRTPEISQYLDPAPGPEAREAILAQINALVPEDASTTLHPSLTLEPESLLSPLLKAELERVAVGSGSGDGGDGEGDSASRQQRPPPLRAIDTSRYESVAAPSADELARDPGAGATALRNAYASHEYLSGREENLSLLDAHGRPAWLMANHLLERQLAGLERELAATREEGERVDNERRNAYQGGGGGGMGGNVGGADAAEINILRESWREGVGRLLEAEVAGEQLRRRILEQRKKINGGAATATATATV